jgi:class 3 adenylate cyclase
MIKAGYKTSGVNEVAWMGGVVGEAAKLCSQANRQLQDCQIMVSKVFYSNLNDMNKKLLKYHPTYDCFHGNVVATAMNQWLQTQRKLDAQRFQWP